MLSNTLNTNEIKNAAGVEVEFQRRYTSGLTTEFAQVGESPNLEHRLKLSHQEIGSGIDKRRRSVVRFDKNVTCVSGKVRPISCYTVCDIPVGDLASDSEVKNVIAENMSFLSTTGAGTTVLFDCSGNGAAALNAGTL